MTRATTLQAFVTISNELGLGEEFLAKVAVQAVAEAACICSYCYQAFTSLFEAQLDPSHGTGAWALQELCDDFFVLERFSICTSKQDRCKKEAVVLRLETAFMAPDATPSLKYRGISYLRQNGFAATL